MGSAASSRARAGAKHDQRDDVKRQIDGDSSGPTKAIYQLIDVKSGGGKLIEIIKTRARQQSSSFIDSSSLRQESSLEQQHRHEDNAIDQQIRALVEPLLYNGGRGKLVPLWRLWSWRFNQQASEPADEEEDEALMMAEAEATSGQQRRMTKSYRWVCWKLDERGFVGETALHICFLLSTATHMILAQKLLAMFPMLINDIYTCDEYFGESSLHMAIVNEDVKIVKLLLDHGANVHERCLGSFFLPHDQKARANQRVRKQLEVLRAKPEPETIDLMSLDLHSNHFSSPQTNYEAYTYWGEFPLSFAASLGLSDCYKLLLAKGAHPNRPDSNGNTTLHICVLANRIDMFDLCYSNGADLECCNKLGLTPLTLAARLKRVQMLFHILTIQRQLSWLFCNVGFVDYPLRGIDSINTQTGACDDHSLLSIVVAGASNEHLQMLDGLLSDLLQVKWDSSLRQRFYLWLTLFVLLLLLASLAYITRFQADNSTTGQLVKIRLLNQLSELSLLVCVLYYLFVLIKRCHLDQSASGDGGGKQAAGQAASYGASSGLVRVLAQAPELCLFTLTCLLILLCIPLRLLQLKHWEDSLAALIMFLLPLKLLFFCRGSKSLGSFIVMIYRILLNDVLCFVVFLIIFISGFAQSFVIIFKTYRRPQTNSSVTADQLSSEKVHLTSLFESIVRGDSHFLNLFDALITMHMMALNEFSWVLDEFHATDHPKLAKLLFCVYMILVSILLINMLIAMLGKTYQEISSQPNENLRQWARALLTLERICSRSARLQMLDKYSHLVSWQQMAQQSRCYSSTWALKGDDLEEIHKVKCLKREQAHNAARLQARATRKSNSILASSSLAQERRPSSNR